MSRLHWIRVIWRCKQVCFLWIHIYNKCQIRLTPSASFYIIFRIIKYNFFENIDDKRLLKIKKKQLCASKLCEIDILQINIYNNIIVVGLTLSWLNSLHPVLLYLFAHYFVFHNLHQTKMATTIISLLTLSGG